MKLRANFNIHFFLITLMIVIGISFFFFAYFVSRQTSEKHKNPELPEIGKTRVQPTKIREKTERESNIIQSEPTVVMPATETPEEDNAKNDSEKETDSYAPTLEQQQRLVEIEKEIYFLTNIYVNRRGVIVYAAQIGARPDFAENMRKDMQKIERQIYTLVSEYNRLIPVSISPDDSIGRMLQWAELRVPPGDND